jgi:MFS superfamily sulfate permease-like transporter
MLRNLPKTLARDLPASFVVFLVGLPLCLGIAIASGVSPEKGLLTGIVGGLVVGLIAGSPLQVSGPAAGLAVIVFELVRGEGIGMLGPILLLAGLLQFLAGLLRLGQWFRAISPAVVHGMLAGIGLLIVAAQFRVLLDASPMPNGLANLAAIPGTILGLVPLDGSADEAALLVGAITIGLMLGWERFRPRALRLVPGALVGVGGATGIALAFGLPVKTVHLPENLVGSLIWPSADAFSRLIEPHVLVTAVAVAFIASTETLLSAAAVDRMHNGVRTQFDKELWAQGVGNMICGLIGALPMTGVIVRSSANVQAGAASRLSAVLHGAWMLLAVALLPFVLEAIPTAALAGVLVVTGWRLVSLEHVRHLFQRHGWRPAAIWAATFATIVATDLLTGVLVGLGLTLVELLPHLPRLRLRTRQRATGPDEVELVLLGTATFVQLPHLSRALAKLAESRVVRIRADRLRHIDHTCVEMLSDWAQRCRKAGRQVELDRSCAKRHPSLACAILPMT